MPDSIRVLAVLLIAVSLTGCDSKTDDQATTSSWNVSPAEPSPTSGSAPHDNRMITADEMRRRLGAGPEARFERSGRHFSSAMLAGTQVKDLEPLRGQPLKQLDISQTQVSNISPLSGMPLERLAMIKTPVRDLSPLAASPLILLDLSQTPVSDLSPLTGISMLSDLYLDGAQVSDLSALQHLNVRKLWLNGCPVSNLAPLQGKGFIELNLCDTQVSDLSPLAGSELGTLWLRNTSVQDLSPLAATGLVSLDLQGSQVSDLAALAPLQTLQRLNISQTAVEDLTPLQGMTLTRLIFSPERIRTGLEIVRNMSSLRELDTSYEGEALTPSKFWERYDRGDFKDETAP